MLIYQLVTTLCALKSGTFSWEFHSGLQVIMNSSDPFKARVYEQFPLLIHMEYLLNYYFRYWMYSKWHFHMVPTLGITVSNNCRDLTAYLRSATSNQTIFFYTEWNQYQSLLGCGTMSASKCLPTFRRSLVLPFSACQCPKFFLCLLYLSYIGNTFLRNFSNFLQVDTARYSRRLWYS